MLRLSKEAFQLNQLLSAHVCPRDWLVGSASVDSLTSGFSWVLTRKRSWREGCGQRGKEAPAPLSPDVLALSLH